MKKPLHKLFLGTFAISAVFSNAQPVLTATGVNPVIGESFTLFNGNYVSPGSAGAGQTWNLSGISGSSAGLTNVVAPSSTTYGSSFPTATVAANNTTASTVNYYKPTSGAWENHGVVSGTTVIPYSNPEDFLHFPFSYTNTYTDSWAGQFVSGSYTFYRTGTTTVTADGYGTLITPTATYSNVMRVHFVQVYKDSAFVGVPYVITYNNDEYMWYKNGAHVQVALVYTLTTSAGGPYTGGSYVTGTVGMEEASKFISSSDLFPNPAADQITLNFTLTENKKVELKIINALGQQSGITQNTDGISGENSIEVDVTSLNPGIYFAQMMLDGNVTQTKRFVVSN
jgi:hypothetical protein